MKSIGFALLNWFPNKDCTERHALQPFSAQQGRADQAPVTFLLEYPSSLSCQTASSSSTILAVVRFTSCNARESSTPCSWATRIRRLTTIPFGAICLGYHSLNL